MTLPRPPAFSRWLPVEEAEGREITVSASSAPTGKERTVYAIVEGRGSLTGQHVYHFELDATTGGLKACVMPLEDWHETMRQVTVYGLDGYSADAEQDDEWDDLI